MCRLHLKRLLYRRKKRKHRNQSAAAIATHKAKSVTKIAAQAATRASKEAEAEAAKAAKLARSIAAQAAASATKEADGKSSQVDQSYCSSSGCQSDERSGSSSKRKGESGSRSRESSGQRASPKGTRRWHCSCKCVADHHSLTTKEATIVKSNSKSWIVRWTSKCINRRGTEENIRVFILAKYDSSNMCVLQRAAKTKNIKVIKAEGTWLECLKNRLTWTWDQHSCCLRSHTSLWPRTWSRT